MVTIIHVIFICYCCINAIGWAAGRSTGLQVCCNYSHKVT